MVERVASAAEASLSAQGLCVAARRAARNRMARSEQRETMAAGANRLSGACNPDELAAHLRSDEALPGVGAREGVPPARDRLRRPHASPRALTIQREWRSSVEAYYRTHRGSPRLSVRKRRRVVEKANPAPELAVIQPLNQMEMPSLRRYWRLADNGAARSAGWDALASRRAKARSPRFAVVVRFSRRRRRYERQGSPDRATSPGRGATGNRLPLMTCANLFGGVVMGLRPARAGMKMEYVVQAPVRSRSFISLVRSSPWGSLTAGQAEPHIVASSTQSRISLCEYAPAHRRSGGQR
jgi:hypothetical protein